jgi:hypothetical protein
MADFNLSTSELTSTSVSVTEIDSRFCCLSMSVLVYLFSIVTYISLIAVEIHVNSCAGIVAM